MTPATMEATMETTLELEDTNGNSHVLTIWALTDGDESCILINLPTTMGDVEGVTDNNLYMPVDTGFLAILTSMSGMLPSVAAASGADGG